MGLSDKLTQLQDILADLHITPDTKDTYGILDNCPVQLISDKNLNYTGNPSNTIDNESGTHFKRESSELKLHIPKVGAVTSAIDAKNCHDEKQEQLAMNTLSPNSIWKRTRETNHNLSTASSNDDGTSPFKFNAELKNIEFSTDSDSSSYHSVASSIETSVLTAEEGGNWVYLLGNRPTQTDRQVYDIIKDVNVQQYQYPSINNWKILIETSSEEERKHWSSYENRIRNLTSDLLISQSNIIHDVKSKLYFGED